MGIARGIVLRWSVFFGMICIIATVFIIAWDRHRQIKREVLEKLNKVEMK